MNKITNNKNMNEIVDLTNVLDDCPKETNSSQYKNKYFDPTTFKPFDKVLAKIYEGAWYADFISVPGDKLCYVPSLIGNCDFNEVVPYNDETKHLLGTTDEAPDYYHYWDYWDVSIEY